MPKKLQKTIGAKKINFPGRKTISVPVTKLIVYWENLTAAFTKGHGEKMKAHRLWCVRCCNKYYWNDLTAAELVLLGWTKDKLGFPVCPDCSSAHGEREKNENRRPENL
jgi:hypothetical protein